MTFLEGLVGYWWGVIKRSYQDAFAFSGAKPGKAVSLFAVTLIASYLISKKYGVDKALERLGTYAIFVESFWIFIGIATIVALVCTPFILHREVQAKLKSAEQEAKNEALRLKSDFESKEQTLVRANDQLTAQLNNDPGKKIIKDTLNNFLQRLAQAKRHLEACEKNSIRALYGLDTEIAAYLAEHFPEFKHYGRKIPTPGTHITKIKYTPEDVRGPIILCEDRIESVNKVLGYLRV